MPVDAPPAPPAPPATTRDLSKTPTMLETVAAQFDITGAPTITARQLPSPIKNDGETIKREEKKVEPKPKEEDKSKDEKPAKETKEEEEAAWKKAGEAVADKLFRKKSSPKEDGSSKGKAADGTETSKKVEEPPATVKEDKPKEEKPKPTPRRRASEAEITERAAAAAAEAATRAVSKLASRSEASPPAKTPDPTESISAAEKKQYIVYQELEASQPDRYKGITQKYLKSLGDIQDYVKTWTKDNPGEKFNTDDEQHDAFFERVEPQVDEDDWVDAKANIRAREISSKAIAPVNEKLEEMEKERARQNLEPMVRQKQVESVHLLLNEFEPAIIEAIRKPDGLKELAEKDPITAAILGRMAQNVGSLAGEIVRLEDPKAGINFDPKNDLHLELADFIIGQERRIAALPPEERTHEGRMFVGRQQRMALPPEERTGYWYLTADHVIYLLAQKYAQEAKKIRDAEIVKFNKTAELMGYKKIEGGKSTAGNGSGTQPEPVKPKPSAQSPESTSRASVKTIGAVDGKPTPSESDTILGKLFQTLKS